jgi:aminopeptidase N
MIFKSIEYIFSLLLLHRNKKFQSEAMKFAYRSSLITIFLCFAFGLFAQRSSMYTKDDTLRGSITPERVWWDLTFYELRVTVDPDRHFIKGSNTIHYKVLKSASVLQVDLQEPLQIEKIEQDGQVLTWELKGHNAYFVRLVAPQNPGDLKSVTVWYGGFPRVAPHAPWDGGFTWSKDNMGNPFVATSCQGLGASVWWPCKDHMYDEPDSMAIAVTVPALLTDVSNGRLRGISRNDNDTRTFKWFVRNPINNYGVNVNIANYFHFTDTLQTGEKGKLSLDYYVLPADVEKAKVQFKQVKLMLEAFEHWFGPYPFYEDGYKLVQVPYLGMEHQSSITYGNGYHNGYLGRDLSGTGWGLKWDFIIVHESGHEWFANNITYKDMADMWIHEGFTAYSEGLYTEYHFGKAAGAAYIIGVRKNVKNDSPIIADYNVNQEGSSDMYYKGSNMLHTIRQIVQDDEKWRSILRGLNKDFYHQTVDTKQIEQYISDKSGVKLGKTFDQYLRTTQIPVLEYKLKKGKLKFRWTNCVKVTLAPGVYSFIYPGTGWKKAPCTVGSASDFKVDENFYITVKS